MYHGICAYLMSSTIDVTVAFVVHAKTLRTFCLAWHVQDKWEKLLTKVCALGILLFRCCDAEMWNKLSSSIKAADYHDSILFDLKHNLVLISHKD